MQLAPRQLELFAVHLFEGFVEADRGTPTTTGTIAATVASVAGAFLVTTPIAVPITVTVTTTTIAAATTITATTTSTVTTTTIAAATRAFAVGQGGSVERLDQFETHLAPVDLTHPHLELVAFGEVVLDTLDTL